MAIRCCKLLEHNIPIAIAIMHLWVMGHYTFLTHHSYEIDFEFCCLKPKLPNKLHCVNVILRPLQRAFMLCSFYSCAFNYSPSFLVHILSLTPIMFNDQFMVMKNLLLLSLNNYCSKPSFIDNVIACLHICHSEAHSK